VIDSAVRLTQGRDNVLVANYYNNCVTAEISPSLICPNITGIIFSRQEARTEENTKLKILFPTDTVKQVKDRVICTANIINPDSKCSISRQLTVEIQNE
jgi:hypothetical protein